MINRISNQPAYSVTYRHQRFSYGPVGFEEPSVAAAIARLIESCRGDAELETTFVIDKRTPAHFAWTDDRYERIAEGRIGVPVGRNKDRAVDLACYRHAAAIRRLFIAAGRFTITYCINAK